MKYSQNLEPIQPYVPPETLGRQPYEPSPQERQLKAQTSATSAQAKLAEQINKRHSGWARSILAFVVGYAAIVLLFYFLFDKSIAQIVAVGLLVVIFFATYDSLKSAQSSALFTRTLDTVATFQARDAATDKARYGAFRAEAAYQSAQLRASKQVALPASVADETDGEFDYIVEDDE